MKRIDNHKRVHNSQKLTTNVSVDPKIFMSPIVFTKKLDKMDMINTNWEPLSFKKITTMLLEESKPEYTHNTSKNMSTLRVRDIKSYNKLENKLHAYFSRKNAQYKELNLESILKMALDNIKVTISKQNDQKDHSTIKNKAEIWSSDDDDALVSVKRRKIDAPKNINDQKTKTMPTKIKITKTVDEILKEMSVVDRDKQEILQKNKRKIKDQANRKKATTNKADILPQRMHHSNNDINKNNTTNETTTSEIDYDELVLKVNRDMHNQRKVEKIEKKVIKLQDFDGITILFNNIGIMLQQKDVTTERYDIGSDGNLQKCFVKTHPIKRDKNRHYIEKTICCTYKRAEVISEIINEYEINPITLNFLRESHLCKVGACLCCCKTNQHRTEKSDASLTSRKRTIRTGSPETIVPSSIVPDSISSTPSTSANIKPIKDQVQDLSITNKIINNLVAHNLNLSIALKGLITGLFTNFNHITLAVGDTGKLLAAFKTTPTAWNNSDVHLITTILTQMSRQLARSGIPPKLFCDVVNASAKPDSYSDNQCNNFSDGGTTGINISNVYSDAQNNKEIPLISQTTNNGTDCDAIKIVDAYPIEQYNGIQIHQLAICNNKNEGIKIANVYSETQSSKQIPQKAICNNETDAIKIANAYFEAQNSKQVSQTAIPDDENKAQILIANVYSESQNSKNTPQIAIYKNVTNLYSEVSKLLGSKQIFILKQYSSDNVEDQTNPQALKTSSNAGPSCTKQFETESGIITISNEVNEDEPTKSCETIRECVFISEPEPLQLARADNIKNDQTANNPMLLRLLSGSVPQSTVPVKATLPLNCSVSVPVKSAPAESCETNNMPIFPMIELSSDEESILP